MRVTVRWSSPLGRTDRRVFDRLHDAHEFAAATRRRFWACKGEDVAHVVKMGYMPRDRIPSLADSVGLELEPDPQPVIGIGEWNRRQREAREAKHAEQERAAPPGP